MKIKMMDLFKLMLERKAPKKIRVLGIDMTFIETAEWGDYNNDNGYRLSEFRLTDCLNEDVEIIEEEPKKIEKISWREKESLAGNFTTSEKQEILARRTEKLKAILNKLIDEINNLKESDVDA